MPATQPDGAFISLGTGTIGDMAFAPDGETVYVARAGRITAYDVATGAVAGAWDIGDRLGGIDVSPGGGYLVAAELTAGPTTPGGSAWENTTEIYAYRLDLATGIATTYTAEALGAGGPFRDVSFLPDGTAIFTQTFNGSGWVPLTVLDFDAGTFTPGNAAFSQDGTLTATADKSLILFLPGNISDAPVHIYTAGTGITATHDNYEDGVGGFNVGVQAISPDGGLIVQGVGLNVYDGELNFLTSLSDRYPYLVVTGMAFSPDGGTLYLLDRDAGKVVALATADWSAVGGYALRVPSTQGSHYGDALLVSEDGGHLAVAGEVSVELIDLALAVSDGGTAGDDVLSGDGADNIIFGFDGDDVIDGKGGVDTMYGGKGDDTYLVNEPGGENIIEYEGEGNDKVVSSVNFILAPNVETLQLIGDAVVGVGTFGDDTLIGNEVGNNLIGYDGDDVLIGNGGDDFLDGGLGNDAMAGGQGDDLYYVDSPADTVVELDGEGHDTIAAWVSYTLPDHVEALNLQGFTASLSGTGNALDNVINGNDGDNVLSGLAGDDALSGNAGDDLLRGGAGDDTLNGGAGNDIALYSGNRADYQVKAIGQALRLTDRRGTGGEGTDFVLNVETFRFADGDVSYTVLHEQAQGPANDWRLITSEGFAGKVGGGGSVLGNIWFQDVAILPGNGAITFDPSFNRGGDIIRFPGDAADWSIVRNGSSALLASGDMAVTVPVGGGGGIVLSFDDGARLLRFDVTEQGFKIGAQSFGEALVAITAPADGATPPGGAESDPDAIARLFLAPNGTVAAEGNIAIFGTPGSEQVSLFEGRFALDPSFNRGGDRLALNLDAEDFTAMRVGSSVILESADSEIVVPVGLAGMTLAFADGDRTLVFDSGLGAIRIGDQQIGFAPVALTDFA